MEEKPYNEDLLLEDEKKIETNYPKNCSIVFFNDDYTSFEFVEYILKYFFNKTSEEAIALAKKIHLENKAIVGTYTQDLADQKYTLTQSFIQKNELMLLIKKVPA